MTYDRRQLDQFAKELGVFPGQNDPSQQLIDAAARDIAVVVKDVEATQYMPGDPDANTVVVAGHLAAQLGKRGHNGVAASWAIYRLIELGRLGAEIAEIQLPRPQHRDVTTNDLVVGESTGGEVVQNRLRVDEVVTAYLIPPSTAPGRAIEARLPDGQVSTTRCRVIQYLVVWPTEELWAWCRSASTTVPALTSDEPQRDGPVESLHDAPNEGYFRWKGKLYRFSGKSWQLLHCLWGRTRVSYADIGERVWGDALTPSGTIGSALTRLNNAMLTQGIPLAWCRRNKHVVPDE